MGEGEHKTFVGGFASILACSFILPFALLMMMPIFISNPDFNIQEKITFLAPVNNTETYEIESLQVLLATKTAMNTPIENFNFTKYIVPVYV